MKEITRLIQTYLSLQRSGQAYIESDFKDHELKQQAIDALLAHEDAKEALAATPFSTDPDSSFQLLLEMKSLRTEIASHVWVMKVYHKNYPDLTSEQVRALRRDTMESIVFAPDSLRAQNAYRAVWIEDVNCNSSIYKWLRKHDPSLLEDMNTYIDSQRHKPTWEALSKDQKAAVVGAHLLVESPLMPLWARAARALVPRLACKFVVFVEGEAKKTALSEFDNQMAEKTDSALKLQP